MALYWIGSNEPSEIYMYRSAVIKHNKTVIESVIGHSLSTSHRSFYQRSSICQIGARIGSGTACQIEERYMRESSTL